MSSADRNTAVERTRRAVKRTQESFEEILTLGYYDMVARGMSDKEIAQFKENAEWTLRQIFSPK